MILNYTTHVSKMLSSHQPNATLPEAEAVGASGVERNTSKEPHGGNINLPFSDSTKVVPGIALRTNAFMPPEGSPSTLEAYWSFIRGLGKG